MKATFFTAAILLGSLALAVAIILRPSPSPPAPKPDAGAIAWCLAEHESVRQFQASLAELEDDVRVCLLRDGLLVAQAS